MWLWSVGDMARRYRRRTRTDGPLYCSKVVTMISRVPVLRILDSHRDVDQVSEMNMAAAATRSGPPRVD
jgi:hypothetical protein